MINYDIINTLEVDIHIANKLRRSSADVRVAVLRNVLDLIKRQKAENERLKAENKSIRYCYEQAKSYNDTLAESCEKNCKRFNMTTRAEVIKEFVEKLKEKFGIADCIVTVDSNDIDDLVKEMTEEKSDV